MKDYKILKNSYYDSVTLMSTTVAIKEALNLNDLVMFMGTDMNKDMIKSVGLYHEDLDQAEPNDLMLAIDMKEIIYEWDQKVITMLSAKKTPVGQSEKVHKTMHRALNDLDANMAVISVPGVYAANEAYKALEKNLHVMLFSDNVTIEDEIRLKNIALEKDLLVMGPDCGTAIINGKGLCFANQINQGPIGLVAASGTGLQEVTVIIDTFGGGITQAIGVGGRDLSEKIGGKMMLKGIDVLDADEKTEVIVLISKPPHPSVLNLITERLKTITKPVVLCLLDAKLDDDIKYVHFTSTLSGAAVKALELIGIKAPDLLAFDQDVKEQIDTYKKGFKKGQNKIKGLFCGGTLTAEALSVLRDHVKDVKSNVAKIKSEKMDNPLESHGHNLIDLGDDIFTQGKPHPMIEPSIRFERLIKEAKLEETAVILLDFELGIGSHDDPVGVTIQTLKDIQKISQGNIAIVGYVCGTDKDHQDLLSSEKRLKEIGVLVAKTNAQAALIAAELVKGVA
ncbi:MAG: acyl-CoA synthetase FdrA [Candidatus Izemoplasmataceae bacterium]